MSKRKLTQQQRHRIAASHQQRVTEHTAMDQLGVVISRFGANALVANKDWQLFTCHLRQNLLDVVPGDNVIWQPQTGNQGVITAIQPRLTTLHRITYQGEQKPIAANVTQLIIILAATPIPNSELIDRYIIAAENLGFKILLLVNKIDLVATKTLMPLVKIYQDLGYRVLKASVTQKKGMQALAKYLHHETSIFVGQSGVGKSSLIQYLLPQETLQIDAIAENPHGRHTTTTAALYRFKTGGYVIDSPGVRQFRLHTTDAATILRGYREIKVISQQCQFRDCQHLNEPECAVKTALALNIIHPLRFENWQRIMGSL